MALVVVDVIVDVVVDLDGDGDGDVALGVVVIGRKQLPPAPGR
jgi:hypothetical protein